jgi:aryl-alcohol dehydrogenase-like predicted oxidoreductase
LKTRNLGPFTVSTVGVGAMQMSVEGRPPYEQSAQAIRAAVEGGITFIDTADCYHIGADEVGHNEDLVARALAQLGSSANHVVVATKGGKRRPGDGSWHVDGRPDYLVSACEASLARLGRDFIDLYQLHEPDPRVAFEDSLGALQTLHDQGKVRALGISNVTAEQVTRAKLILGDCLVAVQNRRSAATYGVDHVVALCEALDLTFLAYGPLGGKGAANEDATWQAFRATALETALSGQQVALASLLHQSPAILPIPGVTRPETARACAATGSLALDPGFEARLHAMAESRRVAAIAVADERDPGAPDG